VHRRSPLRWTALRPLPRRHRGHSLHGVAEFSYRFLIGGLVNFEAHQTHPFAEVLLSHQTAVPPLHSCRLWWPDRRGIRESAEPSGARHYSLSTPGLRERHARPPRSHCASSPDACQTSGVPVPPRGARPPNYPVRQHFRSNSKPATNLPARPIIRCRCSCSTRRGPVRLPAVDPLPYFRQSSTGGEPTGVGR
jgi:hypothetical protein